jgi:acetoin utilization protein AcuB
MTKRPITITEDTGIDKALELMHSEKVRRLPVLNKHGQLVGIVSELDLLKASPSQATSLSIYELPYLLSKIKMRDIMTKDVVTVTEDMPLEEAALIMAENKIGGLPVMRGDKLVGIITETDQHVGPGGEGHAGQDRWQGR